MEVTLAQGRVRHSGAGDDLPPDMLYTSGDSSSIYAPSAHRVASSDGSLSEYDADHFDSASTIGFTGKHAAREALRQAKKDVKQCRKAEKRACRSERREMKQEGRNSQEEQWRLIVSFRQPVI